MIHIIKRRNLPLQETFNIATGTTHGRRIALKYARSRKTASDFDRADRQQQLFCN